MDIENSTFLLFGGKGGVGKTSCAAATALYAGLLGKKVLVLSTDPAHSLSDSFDVDIGNKYTSINKNVDALEIDAKELLADYKNKYGGLIRQIADEGTFFSKDDIQQFFDLSLPGMDELMALLKIMDILAEKKYDLLILDTAPTGHTIRLLELPDVMIAYVRVLAEMRRKHHVVVRMMTRRYVKDKADEFIENMYNDIEKLKLVLKDSHTQFLPVLIPEKMAIAETDRLIVTLKKHGISVGDVIVNRVMSEHCSYCISRVESQKVYLSEIRNRFSDIIEVPLFATDIKGTNLDILSSILAGKKFTLPKLTKKKKVDTKKRVDVGVKNVDVGKFTSLKIKPTTEFLLFGGKGGVGKTSSAAAVALHESQAKKVLIFSTDPAHSLGDSLGMEIGNTITKVGDNLFALEMDAYQLLATLKKRYRQEIHSFFTSVFRSNTAATIDAPFDRKVMESLFDLAPPGIDEIMALKTMMDLMEQKKYDLFILDTAPTGHTIRLLEMPEIAEEWVSTLLEIQEKYPISFELGETLSGMLDIIKKVREMLKNSAKSEFVVVSIPEAMSVLETQDLVASLQKLQVDVKSIIVNKIIPASECTFCSAKRAGQTDFIKQLRSLKLELVGVELFPKELQGKKDLLQLGTSLFG